MEREAPEDLPGEGHGKRGEVIVVDKDDRFVFWINYFSSRGALPEALSMLWRDLAARTQQ
jgi:hypothetical protein